jgi:hypothetical protein
MSGDAIPGNEQTCPIQISDMDLPAFYKIGIRLFSCLKGFRGVVDHPSTLKSVDGELAELYLYFSSKNS